ncbi:hypothetical protein ACP70R_006357 [Stipagrostis hirtigluma subsp. patula]
MAPPRNRRDDVHTRHDDSSSAAADSDVDLPLRSDGGGGVGYSDEVDLQPRSTGGYYRPAPAAAAARALGWVPYAAALSGVRGLFSASHEDLRLRAQELSRKLSGVFFVGAPATPFGPSGGARFPEGGLYVCADLPPLGPALQAVQRAIMQVSVKDASHGACDCYYDTVADVMRLLVADAGNGRGPAVFDREKLESAFALEWVETEQ